jgi:hypothetical protein
LGSEVVAETTEAVAVVSAGSAGRAASSEIALVELFDEEEELSLPAPALLGTVDLILSAASALAIDRPLKSPKKEVSV